jgi:DNA-binding MarR family transcriptional regulator
MVATASGRSKAAAPDVAMTTEEAPGRKRVAIDYGPLDRRLGYTLRRAQIAVFRDFFATFDPYDIRPAQYSILTVIESNPGLKQSEVSEALGIARTNFVAMIDELEKRKLVRRAATPNDRRSYALVLTDKGRGLVGELHAVSDQHEQRLIDAVGEKTYRGLFAPLRTIAALGDESSDS